MVDRPDGWPRLDESVLAAMPEIEQVIIRQHEEQTIARNKLMLADICNNCHVRPWFAKNYRVLRRDLREQLEKGRAAMARPNRDFSDAFGAAMVSSTEAIVRHTLARMADHFYVRWGEPIEKWAGEEGSAMDRAGCSILLLVAAAASSAVVCTFAVL